MTDAILTDGGQQRTRAAQLTSVRDMHDHDKDWALDLWDRRYGSPSEWAVDRSFDDAADMTAGYVAEVSGKRAGFGVAHVVPADWIERQYGIDPKPLLSHRLNGILHQVCVEQQYEGRGCATMLTGRRLAWLAAHDIDIRHVVASAWLPRGTEESSGPILERHGFEAAKELPSLFEERPADECPVCSEVCDCSARFYVRVMK